MKIANADGLRILIPFGNIAIYGQEKATIRIFKALKEKGVKTHFITNKEWGHLHINPLIDENGFKRSSALYGPIIGKNVFNPLQLFLILKEIILTSFAVHRQIKKFKPTHLFFGDKVYFVYSFPAFMFSKIPVIYRLGNKVSKGVWGIFFRYIIAKRVSHFVCNSEFIRQNAIQNKIPKEKITVIYNHPPKTEEQSRHNKLIYRKSPGQKIVAYAGQLTKPKGVRLFVEAAIALLREYPDLVFYLAGDYTWRNPFAKNEIRKVKKSGLQDKIIFLGYIKKPEILLQESDIHCCPSIYGDPFPNVVLEAKAEGIPSVVFPDGGLPEMVEHKVDGYITRNKSIKELKEGVSYFLSNENALKTAKRKARESLKKFDRETLTNKWVEIFLESMKK